MSDKKNNKSNQPTKIFALGGLGEIGKNMYVIEDNNEIIIIDAGVMFNDGTMPGIDYILPDFTYLKENEKKIKGLFITHGHEDHIGAIPFLVHQVDIPVIYAPAQASELIRRKIEERGYKSPEMIVYYDDTIIKLKTMSVEFYTTTHSIPDAFGIVVNTPNGRIVHTGDFKFDLTPIGPVADFYKMSKYGNEGVTLLLSESTNADRPGVSSSESRVDETLGEVFSKCDGRVIVATFASHVYRLKHIIETCRKYDRKIVIVGRSLENNIDISIKTGIIEDDGIFVNLNEAENIPAKRLCLLCTGSQGEMYAALTRIAKGTHRQIQMQPGDTVIFSSSPVPGNGASVGRTINQLYLKGVRVFTNKSLASLHTSGHANQEELKLMIRLMHPKYFMPIHGEYQMLKAHANVAMECDIPSENIFNIENGEVLEMLNGKITKSKETIEIGDMLVEGSRIGESHSAVLRDRKMMATDGILVVIANIDVDNNKLIGKVNITTRGFVLISESEVLLKEIEKTASNAINNTLSGKKVTYQDLRTNTIKEVSNFINNKVGRKPIIIPIIMDIRKETRK